MQFMTPEAGVRSRKRAVYLAMPLDE